MSTVREQIVAAACAALNATRPAEVPEYIRTRLDSPSAEQLPVSSVYQIEETVEPMGGPRNLPGRVRRGPVVARNVLLAVEHLTASAEGAEPDKEADPMLAWDVKALGLAGDLGRLANDPPDEEGTRFEYERKETSFCRTTTRWRYYYQSRVDDAEQPA